jgi:transcriptional regulator of arginine metabolism
MHIGGVEMGDLKSGDARNALRELLMDGFSGTQEELCQALEDRGVHANQSTVSRALRKLGAVKAMDATGVVYRMPKAIKKTSFSGSIGDLVRSIEHNESMIVVGTVVGSASFVAEFLDTSNIDGVLGTIAGDDTIFIVPKSINNISDIVAEIKKSF